MQVIQSENRTRQLVSSFQEHMSRYGYEAIELPIIEAADLFLIKAGDQVINKLFTFERHGLQLALRPEFTAAAAYRYIQSHETAAPVTRWQFSGAIFEDDPNDAARHYQRLSVGAELIGMAGATAEAEMMSMAALGIDQQGIRNWRIQIGHMKLIRQVLARFGLDSRTERFILHHLAALHDPAKGKQYILEQLDKLLLGHRVGSSAEVNVWFPETVNDLDQQEMFNLLLESAGRGGTLGGRSRHDIARRLLQKRQRAAEWQQVIAALDQLERWSNISYPPEDAFSIISGLLESDNFAAQKILSEWKIAVQLLAAYGIPQERIIIQPDLARSWEYYSGIVFDLLTDTGVHLGGGGRYDELARLIGCQREVPAVGFAYYMDEFLSVLGRDFNKPLPPVTIPIITENALAAAQWSQQLRQSGIAVQLLPLEQIKDVARVVTVPTNGGAIWQEKPYDTVELLVAELKKS